MSEYQLDVSKWRCGNESEPNSFFGKGDTAMLNHEGYMCCLGQFAKQKGVAEHLLLDEATPECANSNYDPAFCFFGLDDEEYENTNLAYTLMKINDDPTSTPKEKIDSIRKELEKEGHTLTVINEHLLEK